MGGVTKKDATIRFVGMPRHSAMPLLVDGIVLHGCHMDSIGKRLLAQYGGDMSGVMLEEEGTTAKNKIVSGEEKQARHKQHSLEYKAKHTSIDEKTASIPGNRDRNLKAPGRFSLLGSPPPSRNTLRLSSHDKPPSSSSSSSSNSSSSFG